MKVKMLTGLGGERFSLTRGDEYDCDDAEAVRLVRAGYAATQSDEDAKAVADAITALEKGEAAAAKKAAEAAAKKAKA